MKKILHFIRPLNVMLNLIGVGDAWEAANIFGYLLKLQALERPKFSNAFATFYISNSDLESPF